MTNFTAITLVGTIKIKNATKSNYVFEGKVLTSKKILKIGHKWIKYIWRIKLRLKTVPWCYKFLIDNKEVLSSIDKYSKSQIQFLEFMDTTIIMVLLMLKLTLPPGHRS